MCNPGDPSGLTYRNSYWYLHQWTQAVKEAIYQGRREGKKFRVWRSEIGNGSVPCWRIEPQRNRAGEPS